LHVLSPPPAFALSQDQTLQFDSFRSAEKISPRLKNNVLARNPNHKCSACYLVFKEHDPLPPDTPPGGPRRFSSLADQLRIVKSLRESWNLYPQCTALAFRFRQIKEPGESFRSIHPGPSFANEPQLFLSLPIHQYNTSRSIVKTFFHYFAAHPPSTIQPSDLPTFLPQGPPGGARALTRAPLTPIPG
jgi:rubredoxin